MINSTKTTSGSPFQYREHTSLTGVWTAQNFPVDTVVTIPNVDWAITLADAKSFLRVSGNIDDNYIETLIEAVSNQIEEYIGRDTYERTRQSQWDRFGQYVSLPYGPHGDVTSVQSITYDNVVTDLVAGTDYYVQGLQFKSIMVDNPSDGQFLRVTYESGYQPGSCPPAIRGAILQEISLQYKNRQSTGQPSRVSVNGLSIEARHLLQSYMKYVI
jgi:uncharacterized phiE125 gp8 family phage protein